MRKDANRGMQRQNLGRRIPIRQTVAQAAPAGGVHDRESPRFPHWRSNVRKFLFLGLR
jgi:hypothetical protein